MNEGVKQCGTKVSAAANTSGMKFGNREAPPVLSHHELRPLRRSGWFEELLCERCCHRFERDRVDQHSSFSVSKLHSRRLCWLSQAPKQGLNFQSLISCTKGLSPQAVAWAVKYKDERPLSIECAKAPVRSALLLMPLSANLPVHDFLFERYSKPNSSSLPN